MAEFAQQLLTEHPKEASQAFVPMITLLEQLLADAEAAGAIQPALPRRRVAGIVLQAIMFNVFASTISGSSIRPDPHEAAEELWDLLLHGIGADNRG
jgi:hypothetical protein